MVTGGTGGPSPFERDPEEGVSLSALVACLIADSQAGTQAAMMQQIEAVHRESELLRRLPDAHFAVRMVPLEEVIDEARRLFPPSRAELPTGFSAGSRHVPFNQEKGVEEDPPLKAILGYEVRPEDVKGDVLTEQGEKAILEHLWRRLGAERRRALNELHRRGVPYLLVDHGRLNVKLSFRLLRPEEHPPQLMARARNLLKGIWSVPGRPTASAALPGLQARLVNERNIEALGKERGAIGELELSFKIDLW